MDINSWAKESVAGKITNEIMDLYEQYGDDDYDGEPVSQSSHMIQCAMLAMDEGADLELVLGSFLHDIGHLLKHKIKTEEMGGYGVINHEGIGAGYLREKGFSERICAVVSMHVAAKRYLVATDENYLRTLSEASWKTLKWQGGPMLPDEANAFSHHAYFKDIIRVRLWDEAAKNASATLFSLDYFKRLIKDYLNDRHI